MSSRSLKTGLRLSVCQCIRLWALTRSHFLIDVHQNWHRRKNPPKVKTSSLGDYRTIPSPILPPPQNHSRPRGPENPCKYWEFQRNRKWNRVNFSLLSGCYISIESNNNIIVVYTASDRSVYRITLFDDEEKFKLNINAKFNFNQRFCSVIVTW